MLKDDKVMN